MRRAAKFAVLSTLVVALSLPSAGPVSWQEPARQAGFLRDLVAWGKTTGALSGLRPWAPDLPAPGWGPMSFFQLDGKNAIARPALDAVVKGARSQ